MSGESSTGESSTGLVVCSFSGGKDSCLALWRAQRSGLDVRTLLVMFDEAGERSRSHALPLALIEQQAAALGFELMVRQAGWKSYEAVFVGALKELAARGYRSAVFGDIDLQAHRDWEERVCAVAGLRAMLPLWHEDRTALAREVLSAGFRAVVVCVDSRYLGEEYCGREYDDSFIASLPAGVDACGENGEFHTFVYDGPNFRAPLRHRVTAIERYEAPKEYGGVGYWFATLESADFTPSA